MSLYCRNLVRVLSWQGSTSNFMNRSGCQSTWSKNIISLSTTRRSNVYRSANVRYFSSAMARPNQDYIFRQLLDYKSYTYTYLLADRETKDAILIDPVLEMADRDVRLVKDLGLNLKYGVNTHVHADHVTGTNALRQSIPSCKSMIAAVSQAVADIKLTEGDTIHFGKFHLDVRSTPGHTDGCMAFVWQEKGMAFTGDALLIRGCGRTDFQQGNSAMLYDSVHSKILSLPEDFLLYPAHDYTGQTVTTVAEEKKYNPRLTKPKQDFVNIMANLSLPYPKQIDRALPLNMVCGVFQVPQVDDKAT